MAVGFEIRERRVAVAAIHLDAVDEGVELAARRNGST